MKPFTHLHVHSHFSLLTALPRIDDIIEAAKADGATAVALTDNGNLYGAIEFYESCKAENIKPILGIDAYVATRTRHDKEPRIDNKRTRLILIAKDNVGYKSLIKLVTLSHIEGFYYKPRLDRELIEKHHAGLICISPAFAGEISLHLKNDEFDKAKETAEFYKKHFGDDFYLEIVHHPEIEDFPALEKKIKNFAKENNYPLVAAHDVYYIKPDDRSARQTLVSVQNTFGGSESSFDDKKNEDFSFISKETANEYFADIPEALENTQKIVDKCNLDIPLKQWKFPNFIIESGRNADEELRHMAMEGFKRKNITETPELIQRINYELEIIKNKGYSKYFLVVADLFKRAKELKIQSNTRGSAAGSYVSYLCGITAVNPVEFGLPFERFLNPERPSAPDIDMDFADQRRDELLAYVREKYGKDHVAQIGTFGTMLARGSVRDTARAMGFDYEIGDRIAKLIPMGAQGFPMTINKALKEVPELQDMYNSDEEVAQIIDMARKIEGCARHIGVHAAGVVISPDPLDEHVPVQFDPKGEGKLITQYDMHAVGEDGIGLLKFDFLGLKNLTIIGNTLRIIKKLRGIELDTETIPLDDKKTYEMLTRGETTATFQLNGQGMTKFLKELKPTTIHDINAMVALYRPGPMAFIPDYIERKNDPSKVTYINDEFKKIIEGTYGVLIYQDDIMLIAVNIAGYSWGEADKFRKAMGKKIPEVMKAEYEKFTKGCIEKGGLSKTDTKKLWESIETFAAYGFNKGHAASYGRVAYITAYLKANYPVIYMAAVLTADSGDTEKIAEMIADCKKININVLPPDINKSFEDFTVVENPDTKDGEIRFGLTTIKNFGEGIAHEIIEERKRGGEFSSLENFISRVQSRSFNKKSLEALIKTGALDSLGERNEMIENLEEILAFNKEVAKSSSDQSNLFADSNLVTAPQLRLKKAPPATAEDKLMWEKELLGLYISGHPLDKFKSKFEKADFNISKIKKEAKNDTTVKIIGHVESVREITTKKGDPMAFVRIADNHDFAEVVFFPKVYEKAKKILLPGECIIVKGKVSNRNGEFGLLVDKADRLANLVK